MVNTASKIIMRLPAQPEVAIRPIFRSIPLREVGMPVARAIFESADEMPNARRAENENPNFLPISIPSDKFEIAASANSVACRIHPVTKF